MSKSCKICSSSKDIQDCVIALKKEGKSHRNIEGELKDRFDFSIASSSIGHHLKNCLNLAEEKPYTEDILQTLEQLAGDPPENDLIRHALCNVLARLILIFNQRLDETSAKTTPYNVHLETFKCFETLVNIRDKLYPKQQGTGEGGSLREKFHDLLEPMSPEERQELIAQDRQFS